MKKGTEHWRPGCHVHLEVDPIALRPDLSAGLPFAGDSVSLLLMIMAILYHGWVTDSVTFRERWFIFVTFFCDLSDTAKKPPSEKRAAAKA